LRDNANVTKIKVSKNTISIAFFKTLFLVESLKTLKNVSNVVYIPCPWRRSNEKLFMYVLRNNHSGIVFYVKFGWWLLVEKKGGYGRSCGVLDESVFRTGPEILNLAVNHVNEHAIGVELF
jgi:hypothetical protein